MHRFYRAGLVLLALIVLLALAGMGTLLYWINGETVERTVGKLADATLGADVRFDGEVSVTPGMALLVQLPALTLTDKTQPARVIARVASAQARIALWRLLLGSVHVAALRLEGAQLLAAFDAQRLRWPEDLTIDTLTLSEAAVLANPQMQLTHLTGTLRHLDGRSPAQFDLSARLKHQVPANALEGALQARLPWLAPSVPAAVRLPESPAQMRAQGHLHLADDALHFDELMLTASDARQTLEVKADRLSRQAEELSAVNLQARVTAPTGASLRASAADMRWSTEHFLSPQLRLDYRDATQSSAWELASAVRFERTSGLVHLDGLQARWTDHDIEGAASGSVTVNAPCELAQVSVSGALAGAELTFNGFLEELFSSQPKWRGELLAGDIALDAWPATLTLSDWLPALDFEGALRIGQARWHKAAITQLNAQLRIHDGVASLSDVLANCAEGRLIGSGQLTEQGDWLFDGHVDSLHTGKLLASLGADAGLQALARGTVTVAGHGTEADAVTLKADLTFLRGTYRGIEEAALRTRLFSELPVQQSDGAGLRFAQGSAVVEIEHQRLVSRDAHWQARGMHARTDVEVDLKRAWMQARALVALTPMPGMAAVELPASLCGPVQQATWRFDWAKAEQAWAHVQSQAHERAFAPETGPWQSVQDFLRF